ncbi:ribulose-phosphate 3-epimerase [Spirochaetia bacterium]|nr:ribulose-phosphate 3-epimerase [Spirochaetia bacterium]
MQKYIIAPSILTADFSHIAAAVAEIDASGAAWTHFDVMDGRFVPNFTFGPKLVGDLRAHSPSVFDVHLMVSEPENFIEDFAHSGADYITFHIEAAIHAFRLVKAIRDLGKKAGVSIVPSTPVWAIEELLPMVDLILVMTVNPGFGGQELIPQCLDKVKTLDRLRKEGRGDYLISVDGGINLSTASAAREAGSDVLVAGSAFFNAPDKAGVVTKLLGEP